MLFNCSIDLPVMDDRLSYSSNAAVHHKMSSNVLVETVSRHVSIFVPYIGLLRDVQTSTNKKYSN